MRGLLEDVRYAVRVLARSRGFTIAALLTLAIGIGATTAIFSVLYAVVIAPLPFRDPSRLVIVWETDPHNSTFREGTSLPDLRDWQSDTKAFSAVSGAQAGIATLTDSRGSAERLEVSNVLWNAFAVLGVQPARGRGFTASDDVKNAEPVAIISDGLWQRRYGGADVLDRTILLDGKPHRVIGIMPPRFAFPADAQVWLPLMAEAQEFAVLRGVHSTVAFARLAGGVSIASAQSEMDVVMTRLGRQYSDTAGRGARVEPMLDAEVGEVRPRLFLLTAAVALVLLIGCLNIAGLMLARSGARARELAIRASLGASRLRVVRQLFIESLVLALGGAAFGVGVAVVLTRTIVSMLPDLPRADSITMQGRVLVFAAGVAVLSAVIFGLVPAWRAASAGQFRYLRSRDGDSARSVGRSVLVVVEIALAVVLVSGAGLLLRSLRQLIAVDSGVRADHVLSASFQLPAARYPVPSRKIYPHWPEAVGFYPQELERLRAVPGVQSAALAAFHPFVAGFTTQFEAEGVAPQPAGERDEVRIRPVSAGYFETLGIQLLSGRTILESDSAGSGDVLVANEALVKRYFPAINPIGKRISFWGHDRIIVGVVRGERFRGLDRDVEPAVYPPLAQLPMGDLTILARVGGDPMRFAAAIRQTVQGLDSTIAVADLERVDARLTRSTAAPRLQTLLVTLFGLVALLLAATGLYGLIAYQVQRRTHEIGVRVALGATTPSIVRMIVGRGVFLACVGVFIGVASAIEAARFAQAYLFHEGAFDPLVYSGVCLLLVLIALAASYVPARRAARIDPVAALRYE